ncbi:MAG: HAD family phosphatase [Verrucomicrobiota bacterium JB023]|nr:HAD family phosphatase [Verrucomicrobiota bacterium JB023]
MLDVKFPEGGFEGLVFDLDGTLVDSMPAHFEAWCEALERAGAPGIFPEDVFYAMGGRPTRDIVADLNSEHGLSLNAGAVALSKRDAFLRRLDQVTIYEEVVEFARQWRGKVPMAIATGGTRIVVEKTLQVLELSSLFDEVVTADDVSAGKPAPDIYLKAAELLGVDPTKCVAFEDAAPGIMSAQLAGMEVIAIPSPMRVIS